MPHQRVQVSAIVAAGGRGERLGGSVPKQFLDLGGRSVLQRSVDAIGASGLVDEIVVALPEAAVAPGDVLRDDAAGCAVRIVAGGSRRQDSVASAFDAVAPESDVVLVHDAARPFVSRAVIARVIDEARLHGAAIAAVRSTDTVKRAAGRAGRPVIEATLAREDIWLAQTPQGFRYDVLRAAIDLGRSGVAATDEAALAELAGHVVSLVEGDRFNVKITTASDLTMARVLAAGEPPAFTDRPSAVAGPNADRGTSGAPVPRVGIGYDLHRLVEGRPLILGGVRIPHDRGLAGHSDADAVAHAITDAILGAASLGDIGSLFPDTDARWKDADSLVMLAEAVARLRAAGCTVSHVDVVVIAERPKIGPYRDRMREVLAGVLGVGPDDVSVKGKTNEGVGAIGRGEALAVHAVALVCRTA